jgi:F-type H+-transporting ATPase subunit a
MGLEFLTRVRRSSLWLGAIAALVAATYTRPSAGLALAAGVAWYLVNLYLLERLIVTITGPLRRVPRERGAALGWLLGFTLLFVAGWFLLTRLPATLLMIGFAIPQGVMLLKALSLLLLPSRLWRRIVRTPWPAVAVAIVLVAGGWAVTRVWSQPERHDSTVTETHVAPGAEPAAGEHGAAEAHGEEKEAGPEKFANIITVLHRAFPDAPWSKFLHHYEVVIFSLFIGIMLCVVAMIATRNPQMIPGNLQNLVEMAVEGLYNFIVDILGPKYGPRYVPFLGTLFIYILAMNLFGLIPFMDSPTSSLNVTVALALVVFIYSQYIGFKELGPLGWLDHMAGNPRGAIGWALVPLMLPIHLMGELAKPISLACRLFGNIFGEDMLLVAFASLGITVLSATHLPIGIPLQLPFMFLALLTSTLQALVFTVLSTIYFLLMLPHDDHAHEHEGEVQHAH